MAELKPYTRAIARKYNNIRFKQVKASGDGSFEFDRALLEEAKDFLVMSLTGKTQGEIDSMETDEFEKLYEECKEYAGIDKEEEKQKNS